jgi:hypothetical protein
MNVFNHIIYLHYSLFTYCLRLLLTLTLQGGSDGDGGSYKTTVLQKSKNRYVILDFKLLNWKYMNFTKQFDENTYVFAVKVCRLAHQIMTLASDPYQS